jgi:hypothetical protein
MVANCTALPHLPRRRTGLHESLAVRTAICTQLAW